MILALQDERGEEARIEDHRALWVGLPCIETVQAIAEDGVKDEFARREEAAEAGVARRGEAALDLCVEFLFWGGSFVGVGAAGGEGRGGAFAGIVTELGWEWGVTWGTIVLEEELVELERAVACSDMHWRDKDHLNVLSKEGEDSGRLMMPFQDLFSRLGPKQSKSRKTIKNHQDCGEDRKTVSAASFTFPTCATRKAIHCP